MHNTKWSLQAIDDDWQAVHQATLVFITRGTQVLLIRKKRGLGAGKINGPGGKLDPGETPLQCAIREVTEELVVIPRQIESRGVLRFQFADGYSIFVHVYVARDFDGEPTETDEALPLWFEAAEIPYEQMWEDDRIWLPRVLGGESVDGKFIFDGDAMLEHAIEFSRSDGAENPQFA